MTPALREACADAMHVIRADGSLLRGAEATLYLYDVIGYPRTAATLARAPFIWALRPFYRFIASHRPLFARFFFRGEDPEAERWVEEGT